MVSRDAALTPPQKRKKIQQFPSSPAYPSTQSKAPAAAPKTTASLGALPKTNTAKGVADLGVFADEVTGEEDQTAWDEWEGEEEEPVEADGTWEELHHSPQDVE